MPLQFNYVLTVVIVIWALGLAGGVASITMFMNRKPGSPMFVNPLLRPDLLNERGLRARRWGIGVMVCGFTFGFLAVIIGLLFFRK